jgi:2-desacetyl-2-hydroxyethyl bacteriochlorophyllide A dehydrogenase
MIAVQLVTHGSPGSFRIIDLPAPAPGPRDVRLAVGACGLNHLDLWLEEGGLPMPVQLPRIPGCEISGTIDAVGTEVTDWTPGDRVAVQSNLFCGHCEFCRRGDESLCLEGELIGVDRDGGFAQRVVVPARSLVRLPDRVDFVASAALTLAGSTAMHMLTRRAQVRPGDWVLAMGAASGVGSAAIQIAKALGARVITTASSAAKRELAARLGADHVVDLNKPSWPTDVRRLTDKHGVDLVVEHLGGAILEHVFGCLARGGTVVTCGATTGREVNLKLWPFFVKEQRLIGSYGRNRADIAATLDWLAEGRLRPVVDRTVSLAETPDAFAALRSRSVLGKRVVVPDAGETSSLASRPPSVDASRGPG